MQGTRTAVQIQFWFSHVQKCSSTSLLFPPQFCQKQIHIKCKAHLRTHTHARMHARTHARTHTHTHTHTQGRGMGWQAGSESFPPGSICGRQMATPYQNANWNSFNGEDGKPIYVSVTPHCYHCNQKNNEKGAWCKQLTMQMRSIRWLLYMSSWDLERPSKKKKRKLFKDRIEAFYML